MVARVLLVEDSETDEALALRALERSSLDIDVAVARDGEAACELLAERHSDFSVVLLDINLPKRNGFEVLQFLRENDETRFVPVVMLSSSDEPRDIRRAAELGANSYIQKAMDPSVYDATLKLAMYYWLSLHKPCHPGLGRVRRPRSLVGG